MGKCIFKPVFIVRLGIVRGRTGGGCVRYGDRISVGQGKYTKHMSGFMAVSLFTRLPVALYKFCITLQTTFSDDLMSSFTGSVRGNLGDTASVVLKSMAGYSGLIGILTVIALAYCVIKLFFANIKRGGILLFLGLLTWQTNMLLGLGIMLSASEVPRIAQQFGLDTSVRFNMVSVSSTVNTAMRAGKFVTGKLA